MQSLVVVLALIVLCSVQAKPLANQPEPDFCNGLECPHFETVKKTKNYEIRHYEKDYKWTSTIVTGYEYDEAVRVGFMRLFKYIEGDNVENRTIPMTAPVAVMIQAGQGPFCKNNFTVNFFVPFEDQKDPIEPTSKDVYTSTLRSFYCYVASYGGFSDLDAIQDHSKELSNALVKDGLGDTFRKDVFFYAGYDSPFKLFNRHNEIWFIKKESDNKSIFF